MFSFDGRTGRLPFFFWEFGSSLAMVALMGALGSGNSLPLMLVLGVPIVYARSAAAFRRANDAEVGLVWPRLYAASAAFGLVGAAAMTWLGKDGATGTTFTTIAIWAYLQYVPTRGVESRAEEEGTSALEAMSDEELIARAAQLRPREPKAAKRRKQVPTIASSPKTGPNGPAFARRAQPAFGKRS